jgi:hypothetical protein
MQVKGFDGLQYQLELRSENNRQKLNTFYVSKHLFDAERGFSFKCIYTT